MSNTLELTLIPAHDLLRDTSVAETANGIRYSVFGEHGLVLADLQRVLSAVPKNIASTLKHKIYFFVPLAIAPPTRTGEGDTAATMIAPAYTLELGDQAICHRNVDISDNGGEAVFISTRLHPDKFALAFEFFINVAHGFTDTGSVADGFSTLVWQQARANVRGETSQDAWEARAKSTEHGYVNVDVKFKNSYLESAFSDSLAIYLLSLTLDFNYHDLREREYPLLAPQALADRLREMHKLFPPNSGYDFAIRYRRRG